MSLPDFQKNYQQPPQRSQTSDFQSHFQCWKMVESFLKKHFQNIWLGDQLFSMAFHDGKPEIPILRGF